MAKVPLRWYASLVKGHTMHEEFCFCSFHTAVTHSYVIYPSNLPLNIFLLRRHFIQYRSDLITFIDYLNINLSKICSRIHEFGWHEQAITIRVITISSEAVVGKRITPHSFAYSVIAYSVIFRDKRDIPSSSSSSVSKQSTFQHLFRDLFNVHSENGASTEYVSTNHPFWSNQS